jgi:hypothetical protein
MRPLHCTYTLLRSGIFPALMTLLGPSYANDATDHAHRSTAQYNKDTAETRAARMRRVLRETSEGQAMRQECVQHMFEALQYTLNKRGLGETVTNEHRAKIASKIESEVLKSEEIKRFASYNSRLAKNPLSARAFNPVLHEKCHLAATKTLFEDGKISEEEVHIAERELQLAKEKHELDERFTNLLISANNSG